MRSMACVLCLMLAGCVPKAEPLKVEPEVAAKPRPPLRRCVPCELTTCHTLAKSVCGETYSMDYTPTGEASVCCAKRAQ